MQVRDNYLNKLIQSKDLNLIKVIIALKKWEKYFTFRI